MVAQGARLVRFFENENVVWQGRIRRERREILGSFAVEFRGESFEEPRKGEPAPDVGPPLLIADSQFGTEIRNFWKGAGRVIPSPRRAEAIFPLVRSVLPGGDFIGFKHRGGREALGLSFQFIYQTYLPESGFRPGSGPEIIEPESIVQPNLDGPLLVLIPIRSPA